MAKVTSKLQVTVPKTIARQYDIRPGTEIEWVAAGDIIRVVPPARRAQGLNREACLRLFDQATDRQRSRARIKRARKRAAGRGWTRSDLYRRGRAR